MFLNLYDLSINFNPWMHNTKCIWGIFLNRCILVQTIDVCVLFTLIWILFTPLFWTRILAFSSTTLFSSLPISFNSIEFSNINWFLFLYQQIRAIDKLSDAIDDTLKTVSVTFSLLRLYSVICGNAIDPFNSKANSIIQSMQETIEENNTLITLRDWLLPMLMNGQATISDWYNKL